MIILNVFFYIIAFLPHLLQLLYGILLSTVFTRSLTHSFTYQFIINTLSLLMVFFFHSLEIYHVQTCLDFISQNKRWLTAQCQASLMDAALSICESFLLLYFYSSFSIPDVLETQLGVLYIVHFPSKCQKIKRQSQNSFAHFLHYKPVKF